MELRVLGAHNMESKETRMESHLIDGVLALDAGGLTRALSFEEQQGMRATDTSTTCVICCPWGLRPVTAGSRPTFTPSRIPWNS